MLRLVETWPDLSKDWWQFSTIKAQFRVGQNVENRKVQTCWNWCLSQSRPIIHCTGFWQVLTSLVKLHAYYFINKNELTRMMIYNPIGFTKKKKKKKFCNATKLLIWLRLLSMITTNDVIWLIWSIFQRSFVCWSLFINVINCRLP